MTLVQIDARNTSLTSITQGQYDGYWRSYADKVKTFGRPVILSFDHEMNGSWYPWGYKHESPAAFVAAWRHIVTIFREQGADNVTWLWTVNIVDGLSDVTDPAPWWPGSSYVNWVGIDGYYYSRSTLFPSLFGGTIAHIREQRMTRYSSPRQERRFLQGSRQRSPIYSLAYELSGSWDSCCLIKMASIRPRVGVSAALPFIPRCAKKPRRT